MTAEETRDMIISRIRMMTDQERAIAVLYLYDLEIIEKSRFRKLLGIDEKTYNERVHNGAWLSTLEDRFYSLPETFLAAKQAELLKEFGEY